MVSILLVNWNVRELLRRALQSILDLTPAGLSSEILVVDNASVDGSVEMVRAEFPTVRLYPNCENQGFTRGNNQALAAAQGEYLFLLNPDAEVTEGALPAMVDWMERNPLTAIVGPQLRFPDGRVQSSRRRFPTFWTALFESTILEQWFRGNRWLQRYHMQDRPDGEAQEVDWVVGAAMLVRRKAYEEVGGFDERFFMYSEELDWCYRMRRAGWQVVYLPAAVILHREGQSSQQAPVARDIYFHSSKVLFFRKHHGSLQAGILRACLVAMFAFQTGIEALKWLVGHKRPLRAARVKNYTQVLRSGLEPPLDSDKSQAGC